MKIIHPSEIRSFRSKANLTQAELAEKAGVTQAYIAKIESGDADPKISTLERISKALKSETGSKGKIAEDVMETPIISISSDEKIQKAIKLMESNDISQMPVMSREKQIGSLSEENILHKISAGENLFKLTEEEVGEIMDDPFPTVGTEEELNTIFHLLRHNQTILVSKKGEPVGIITKADILQMSMR